MLTVMGVVGEVGQVALGGDRMSFLPLSSPVVNAALIALVSLAAAYAVARRCSKLKTVKVGKGYELDC